VSLAYIPTNLSSNHLICAYITDKKLATFLHGFKRMCPFITKLWLYPHQFFFVNLRHYVSRHKRFKNPATCIYVFSLFLVWTVIDTVLSSPETLALRAKPQPFVVALLALSVEHHVKTHAALLKLQSSQSLQVSCHHVPYVVGKALHRCLSRLQRLKNFVGKLAFKRYDPEFLLGLGGFLLRVKF